MCKNPSRNHTLNFLKKHFLRTYVWVKLETTKHKKAQKLILPRGFNDLFDMYLLMAKDDQTKLLMNTVKYYTTSLKNISLNIKRFLFNKKSSLKFQKFHVRHGTAHLGCTYPTQATAHLVIVLVSRMQKSGTGQNNFVKWKGTFWSNKSK